MEPTLDKRLRRTLTHSAPLGPSDAAQIEDVEVAAHLFDPHNKSFNFLIRQDVSLILGRRGSGKTALLNSYKYQPFLDQLGPIQLPESVADFRNYGIVIDVVTFRQFDEMQALVAKDSGKFRPVESLVENWATLVLDYFFAKLIASEEDAGRRTQHLELLRDYLDQDEDGYREEVRRQVWGPSLFARIKSFFSGRQRAAGPISADDALRAANRHLAASGKRAVMLIDSMDEYDTSNTTLTRSLGALLRFIAQFNRQQDRIKIKLGLPLEIFPEVQRASANPLKDLANVNQLKWTPIELAQIAAHRFRLFLKLHEPDRETPFDDLDFNHREDVRRFWSNFLPSRQINRYGKEEEAVTYVLRHTQLLPRQFLMIVQRILATSEDGDHQAPSSEAVSQAIAETEPLIANEILSAFSHIYPKAEDLCRPVFANFPTIFTYDELENKWRRKGRPVADRSGVDMDMPHFCEMLTRMGIVGIGQGETDKYYQGLFGYDSLAPANFGEGQGLCLHPIFSKNFGAAGNLKGKAVIPQGL